MAAAAVHAWRGPAAAPVAARVHATFDELHRRSPVLGAAGWLLIAGLAVASLALVVDARTVGGVSVWLKPAKFALSITIYLWTLGWLLHHLPRGRVDVAANLIALVMVLEFVLIFSQAARGTASHFNSATAYDVAVYRAMGVLILANTLAVAYLTFLWFRLRPPLPGAYLLGIRLGFLLFILTAVSGGLMIAAVSHRVGEAGDLRVAHFVAMHALQAMPAAGLVAHRLQRRGTLRSPGSWVAAFALLLLVVHAAVLLLALAGRSLA